MTESLEMCYTFYIKKNKEKSKWYFSFPWQPHHEPVLLILEIEVSWQVGPFVTYCHEAAWLQDETASEFSGAFTRDMLAGPLEVSFQFGV